MEQLEKIHSAMKMLQTCQFLKNSNMAAYKIVMIRYRHPRISDPHDTSRHGESEWNQQNKFCGWYDANLR